MYMSNKDLLSNTGNYSSQYLIITSIRKESKNAIQLPESLWCAIETS